MAGPLNPYLADVLAAFAPGAQLAGYGPPSATPVVSGTPLAPVAPAPNATGFPSLGDVSVGPLSPPPAPVAPIGPPAPTPAMAPMSSPTEDPNALVSRAPPLASQGPAPAVNVGAEPAPAPAAPQMPAIGPDRHAFDLTPVQGGGVPAHEVETRGPSVLRAQDERNAVVADTIGTVSARNQQMAEDEYQQAISQERAARVREAAFQQSVSEQDDELQARQADFDTTTRQMARLGQVDHGRFWASRSTPQKIAGVLEVMLAGFRGAPSMVMKRIDDDVKAQEFAYAAARDQANARQTAFSAAMAKYQNVNAARAAARAASIDVLQAQLSQIAAKNKGNETGNRALMAIADLQNERMLQIQQGIRFVQPQAGGRYYVNPKTGLIYNEKEAHEYYAKQREYAQQDSQLAGKVGGELIVNRDKVNAENEASGGSPLTKEQRGKRALEQEEMRTAAIEFNDQVDALKEHPSLAKLSPVGAVMANAGPRVAPDSYRVQQDLNEINTSIINAIGKVAKDAEGKPSQKMLQLYKDRFEIKQGIDTAASAREKLDRARNVVNSLARQQGSGASPRPGNYITDAEAKDLEGTTSVKFHGGKK